MGSLVAAFPSRQPIGGQQDENGCYTSAGYSWCGSLNACIRSWETDCWAAASPPPPAAAAPPPPPQPPQSTCDDVMNPEACNSCQANGGWYVDSNADDELSPGGYICNFNTYVKCNHAKLCGSNSNEEPTFCPLKTSPNGDEYFTAYCG